MALLSAGAVRPPLKKCTTQQTTNYAQLKRNWPSEQMNAGIEVGEVVSFFSTLERNTSGTSYTCASNLLRHTIQVPQCPIPCTSARVRSGDTTYNLVLGKCSSHKWGKTLHLLDIPTHLASGDRSRFVAPSQVKNRETHFCNVERWLVANSSPTG